MSAELVKTSSLPAFLNIDVYKLYIHFEQKKYYVDKFLSQDLPLYNDVPNSASILCRVNDKTQTCFILVKKLAIFINLNKENKTKVQFYIQEQINHVKHVDLYGNGVEVILALDQIVWFRFCKNGNLRLEKMTVQPKEIILFTKWNPNKTKTLQEAKMTKIEQKNEIKQEKEKESKSEKSE